ncbi:MAG TPA: putative glycoside hydrolase [Gammaproteobacteria bacterium]|nr:putative glycoside hydrolase [Gammaproteobacteria bacterium]
MLKNCRLIIILLVCFFILISEANASVKGIYLTQYTFENTAFLNYLIKYATASGIDTFVIDFEKPSKRYRVNLTRLVDNNIRYVARIVMFPDGGTRYAVKTPEFWQKKYTLVKQAVDWGAKEIQLDYIRYNTKQKPSSENSKDIYTIIQWYKNKLSERGIPLQVDVFGIASFGESKYIGQNIKLFSQGVDAICPMVYPSHYEPFAQHYKTPYQTVYHSLINIKNQFNGKMPIKMYAYIELSNYHYRMSQSQKIEYIKAQMRAVEAANADGWYAWSPHNRYENLFHVLQSMR